VTEDISLNRKTTGDHHVTPEFKSLLQAGPKTAKEIATALNLSPGRVRALLKEDQATIRCRKNDDQQNVFWLEADDFEATEEELAAQSTRQEIQAEKNPSVETPTDNGSNGGANTCPLCQAEADQVQAGPEGSYLGAARTCSACKKTYNVFTKEEVKMAKEKAEGSKRAAPLNPQYKINQKVDAAKAAGGKLTYQREGRTWLLTGKGVEAKQMTAVEFSNETAESIAKYLGKELPAKAPKAEKPTKAEKAPKAEKPAKASKAKSDKELVGA
jgi:hypothetical protein